MFDSLNILDLTQIYYRKYVAPGDGLLCICANITP